MTTKSKSKPWEPCIDISILVGSFGETKQPLRKLARLHYLHGETREMKQSLQGTKKQLIY
jgi:hypothetical protein